MKSQSIYPQITISFAQTLDGRIATCNGISRYISDEASLEMNQAMRREHDGILVGIGTVLKDNPLLTCRLDGCTDPTRVIVDSRLRLPADSQLVQTAGSVNTLVYCSTEHLKGQHQQAEFLRNAGIELIPLSPETAGEHFRHAPGLDLDQLLRDLKNRGITRLMVEGGSGIITSLIRLGLWHRLTVVSVGKIMGSGIEAVGDLGIRDLKKLLRPEIEDIRITGREAVWYMKNPAPPEQKGSVPAGPSNSAAADESASADNAKLTPGSQQQVKKPAPFPRAGSPVRMVYFTGIARVELRKEKLRRPKNGEVVVQSLAGAISPGTERNFYLGRFQRGAAANPDMDFTDEVLDYPFSYGYINVVQDEDGRRYFAFAPHGDFMVISRDALIPLPHTLTTDQALFIPHLETALSIIHDSGVQPGDRVLITGAGVVGTLCARILRSIPGVELHIIDPDLRKERWFLPGEFQGDFQGISQSDISIEVSGNPLALSPLMEHTAFEGRIIVASWYGDREISVNLGRDFHKRRLKLISSQVSSMGRHMGSNWNKDRRMEKVIRLLEEIPVDDVITHRFPLDKAAEAFALLKSDELLGLPLLIPDYPDRPTAPGL
ncbi:dihydrofolate reductase family protein [Salinispira pacifica]|uniref:Bacterial bifunctional deaminase-reductase C-terminal domain-containing protein n=1 Tax=Salinispira pacifica TaxID=1307761 RepID=V5WNF1_9SPIO|nr:dihydrofolate reductase family protein [Salinispira pacifica]AHC16774.1 hypothetical protein L21SP2_3436 [Salinispira pacifica]